MFVPRGDMEFHDTRHQYRRFEMLRDALVVAHQLRKYSHTKTHPEVLCYDGLSLLGIKMSKIALRQAVDKEITAQLFFFGR
jgi:hypothetical protein